MALRVLYVHVELCKGTAKNGRYLILDYLKAVVDSTMWRLLLTGVLYGLERLQSSDGGFCIALVPADIWTSLPSSSSLLLPSVLDNQCCCCCCDAQLLFPRGVSNSWYSMQKLGTKTCIIAICAV